MVYLTDPRTFWLNATNIAMGVIALAAMLILIVSIIGEVVRRRAMRSGD
ncbi:MAG TPA: hypothetical protein VE398_00140 [Acidobacteriota bacterium]|nr:hypothetical protein [Acidobacteriota bacterium]